MLSIEELRKKIEQVDASIIKKLAQREELCKQIAQIKLAEGVAIVDRSREKQLFEFYECLCEKYKLSSIFVRRLFKQIIAHSRQIQK